MADAVNTNICTNNSTEADARAVAEMLRGERVVAYRPCFARAFGGPACALLLSQFCFWAGSAPVRERGGGGWFWKPQREITEETGLSRCETETARRKLRDLGILEEDKRGLPATLHFRIDAEALFRRLGASAPPPAPPPAAPARWTRGCHTSPALPREQVCGIPANLFAGFPRTTIEKTLEIAQKRTQTRARPAFVPPAAFGKRITPPPPIPGESERRARPEPSLIAQQIGVNQAGAARFKAALDAARRGHGAPGHNAPGHNSPGHGLSPGPEQGDG